MERRLAAIVAADVAGYSRLMAADETGTLAALQSALREAVEPAIAAHGGRVVKRMGDGLLLEFPSAVEAVQSAVNIQRAMAERNRGAADGARMEFRIGVNVGDVIVQGDDVFGDGVNLAARLEQMAEPGGIYVSRAARDQVRDRLPYALEDLGEHALKNIARPQRVFRVLADGLSARIAAGAPALFTARPAVAVLPFDNMGAGADEDYFVDGLTEDIITALSYWRWFPVIARNSTFVYKGKPKNAVQIGREIGAAYIVEGSARRAGDRVRITVQLIDAHSGHHLWAERYDRNITDVFAVQEEIAERVVVSIEPEIHRAEEQRAARKRPDHLDAWDNALRALSLQQSMTRDSYAQARALLERAVADDPNFAYAWSLLALCHYHEGILGWAGDRQASLGASLAAAESAVAIDDRDWLGHALRGMGRLWTRREYDAALDGQERAVALNPSAPMARHTLACIFEFTGRPAEAIPHLHAIHRLDPRYRFASLALADEALCQFLLGDMEAARASAQKAVRTQPSNVRARQRLVATLAALGQEAEARREAAELARLQPDLSLDYIDTTYPFQRTNERARFVEALRQAGLLAGG